MTTLITALDFFDEAPAMEIVDKIGEAGQWYKIGKQLFTSAGPDMVRRLKDRGKKVFLDLKYHDIPNTVSQAVAAAAKIGADMCNVHALGGPTMLKAAAQSARDNGILLTAVTVLTSMDAQELEAIGLNVTPEQQVRHLARLAEECGVPGVVCSALELDAIRKSCGPDFITVVPGIRPVDASQDDQKRIMTPGKAKDAGASFIVVGRPITKAENPAAAASAILREIQA